jgi:flagellar basal body-associated protein FliL
MQISLAFETNLELNAELSQRKDELIHIVNILMQGKKYEEMNSVAGVVELSEELKAHVNMRLIKGKIKEIYFKEFVLN